MEEAGPGPGSETAGMNTIIERLRRLAPQIVWPDEAYSGLNQQGTFLRTWSVQGRAQQLQAPAVPVHIAQSSPIPPPGCGNPPRLAHGTLAPPHGSNNHHSGPSRPTTSPDDASHEGDIEIATPAAMSGNGKVPFLPSSWGTEDGATEMRDSDANDLPEQIKEEVMHSDSPPAETDRKPVPSKADSPSSKADSPPAETDSKLPYSKADSPSSKADSPATGVPHLAMPDSPKTHMSPSPSGVEEERLQDDKEDSVPNDPQDFPSSKAEDTLAKVDDKKRSAATATATLNFPPSTEEVSKVKEEAPPADSVGDLGAGMEIGSPVIKTRDSPVGMETDCPVEKKGVSPTDINTGSPVEKKDDLSAGMETDRPVEKTGGSPNDIETGRPSDMKGGSPADIDTCSPVGKKEDLGSGKIGPGSLNAKTEATPSKPASGHGEGTCTEEHAGEHEVDGEKEPGMRSETMTEAVAGEGEGEERLNPKAEASSSPETVAGDGEERLMQKGEASPSPEAVAGEGEERLNSKGEASPSPVAGDGEERLDPKGEASPSPEAVAGEGEECLDPKGEASHSPEAGTMKHDAARGMTIEAMTETMAGGAGHGQGAGEADMETGSPVGTKGGSPADIDVGSPVEKKDDLGAGMKTDSPVEKTGDSPADRDKGSPVEKKGDGVADIETGSPVEKKDDLGASMERGHLGEKKGDSPADIDTGSPVEKKDSLGADSEAGSPADKKPGSPAHMETGSPVEKKVGRSVDVEAGSDMETEGVSPAAGAGGVEQEKPAAEAAPCAVNDDGVEDMEICPIDDAPPPPSAAHVSYRSTAFQTNVAGPGAGLPPFGKRLNRLEDGGSGVPPGSRLLTRNPTLSRVKGISPAVLWRSVSMDPADEVEISTMESGELKTEDVHRFSSRLESGELKGSVLAEVLRSDEQQRESDATVAGAGRIGRRMSSLGKQNGAQWAVAVAGLKGSVLAEVLGSDEQQRESDATVAGAGRIGRRISSLGKQNGAQWAMAGAGVGLKGSVLAEVLGSDEQQRESQIQQWQGQGGSDAA